MHTSSEGIAGKSNKGGEKEAGIARTLWRRLIELWICLAVVIFFLIRVLGSHAGQRLLGDVGLYRLP